jgi:hypothetical protein
MGWAKLKVKNPNNATKKPIVLLIPLPSLKLTFTVTFKRKKRPSPLKASPFSINTVQNPSSLPYTSSPNHPLPTRNHDEARTKMLWRLLGY